MDMDCIRAKAPSTVSSSASASGIMEAILKLPAVMIASSASSTLLFELATRIPIATPTPVVLLVALASAITSRSFSVSVTSLLQLTQNFSVVITERILMQEVSSCLLQLMTLRTLSHTVDRHAWHVVRSMVMMALFTLPEQRRVGQETVFRMSIVRSISMLQILICNLLS